jgi:O-antigen/teichoic acid export membrane protein
MRFGPCFRRARHSTIGERNPCIVRKRYFCHKLQSKVLKKIAGTAFTRFLNAGLSLAIVAVAYRVFGAEAYGTVILVILGITFIQLVNNFVGGSVLVYLVPRFNVLNLFILSYVWAAVVAVAGTGLLHLLALIPAEFRYETMLLSLLFSWASVNMMILLGKENIRMYNLLSVLQPLGILLSILIFAVLLKKSSPIHYLYSLFIAYTLTLLAGLLSTNHFLHKVELKKIGKPLRSVFRLGGMMQLANIAQFFNYRLSFYLLERFYDASVLGRFAVAVQLAEGMWLIAKSVALVQYSRISNMADDAAYAKKVTLMFLKFTIVATLAMLAVLLLLPISFFQMVFGGDVAHLKPAILFLSPGILVLAAGMILSHYFSGTGKPHYNTIASLIGLAVVFVAGIVLIPVMGINGAGLTASFSYLAIFIYQMYWFRKISGAGIAEMIINRKDVEIIINEIKAGYQSLTSR